ncbi:MAG: non-homologous end-joining DNA ligase [Acidimicrobiia bacterium]|nr:non-homologous end-joining DNA ligase [Acidimicrobiia bacterium]
MRVDGRDVEIGNPDKELFDGISKHDLAEHHRDLADVMVPHLRHRPATLRRFPDGIDGDGFFQKRASDHYPEWIRRVETTIEGGTMTQPVVDDAPTLVYLVDQGTIEFHVGLAQADRPDHPDRMVFDLDPPDDGDVDDVRRVAREIRDVFASIDVDPLLTTTGSSGYHVVVPLDRSAAFDDVRAAARRMADSVAERLPDIATTAQRKDRREGRVFVDYLRNARGQTAIAPYSLRALPGAPVATPIEWDELGRTDPGSVTFGSLRRRLGQKDDPWADIARRGHALDTIVRRLEGAE